MSAFQLSVLFFLQVALILLACRLVGMVGRWLGQPQVVCEMIAGVALGPSLLGMFAVEVPIAPGVWSELFPKASMGVIYTVAQVGLAVYMFLIGAEFDAALIRRRLRSAAAVSLAGIVTPFALGALLALWLVGDAEMFASEVSRVEAMLFTGAAMSITAFPMLARIIHERGLSGTSLGTLALAAGSIDDATAWCVLAIVLASFAGDASIAAIAIGGGVGYALVCLLLLRPMLRWMGRRVERGGAMSQRMLGFVLALVMVGAWFTDFIGIYAVFGAFIMGIAMPRGKFTEELHRLLAPMTTALLLPMFFVYSGLNTRIGLVSTWHLWMIAVLALMAATLGKGIACYAAARVCGEPKRDAAAVGALMNARGLMELIILNIGLERGIITPTLFSIMVIMAIVTTLIATPVFEMTRVRRSAVV
ncbi:MAG: cation:proton antiporter [Phycisphaerales bacterium]|nr:cation:proton antiporter [Phycisphaerales bacterium]